MHLLNAAIRAAIGSLTAVVALAFLGGLGAPTELSQAEQRAAVGGIPIPGQICPVALVPPGAPNATCTACAAPICSATYHLIGNYYTCEPGAAGTTAAGNSGCALTGIPKFNCISNGWLLTFCDGSTFPAVCGATSDPVCFAPIMRGVIATCSPGGCPLRVAPSLFSPCDSC